MPPADGFIRLFDGGASERFETGLAALRAERALAIALGLVDSEGAGRNSGTTTDLT